MVKRTRGPLFFTPTPVSVHPSYVTHPSPKLVARIRHLNLITVSLKGKTNVRRTMVCRPERGRQQDETTAGAADDRSSRQGGWTHRQHQGTGRRDPGNDRARTENSVRREGSHHREKGGVLETGNGRAARCDGEEGAGGRSRGRRMRVLHVVQCARRSGVRN